MLNTTVAEYSLVSKQNYSCWSESASSILPNEPPQQLWHPGAQLRAFPFIHALTAVWLTGSSAYAGAPDTLPGFRLASASGHSPPQPQPAVFRGSGRAPNWDQAVPALVQHRLPACAGSTIRATSGPAASAHPAPRAPLRPPRRGPRPYVV
jgi:hypothetical protein